MNATSWLLITLARLIFGVRPPTLTRPPPRDPIARAERRYPPHPPRWSQQLTDETDITILPNARYDAPAASADRPRRDDHAWDEGQRGSYPQGAAARPVRRGRGLNKCRVSESRVSGSVSSVSKADTLDTRILTNIIYTLNIVHMYV